MPAQHAAITIVSKNYLAQAKVLAASYRRHHPDHDFVVILVDRLDGYAYDLGEGVELIEIDKLRLPDFGTFVYRYSVMELNTAVKPYALHRLFEERGYETLLYIDPDIKIYAPLTEVQAALTEANIALIPHMRRPSTTGPARRKPTYCRAAPTTSASSGCANPRPRNPCSAGGWASCSSTASSTSRTACSSTRNGWTWCRATIPTTG